MEKDIGNSTINFYCGGIEFDGSGGAMITYGQKSEDIAMVTCSPKQVRFIKYRAKLFS